MLRVPLHVYKDMALTKQHVRIFGCCQKMPNLGVLGSIMRLLELCAQLHVVETQN